MHDNRNAEISGNLRSEEHPFTGASCRIEVVTLHFTRFGLYLVGSFANEKEPITPPHEWLRVDIFIVLREVKTTT